MKIKCMKREINEKETKVDDNSGHRDPIRINLSSLHNWASSRPSLADSHLQSFLSLQWLPLDLWPSIKDTMKDKPHPHLFSLCSSTPTFPRILLTLDLLLANKEWPQLCYQAPKEPPVATPEVWNQVLSHLRAPSSASQPRWDICKSVIPWRSLMAAKLQLPWVTVTEPAWNGEVFIREQKGPSKHKTCLEFIDVLVNVLQLLLLWLLSMYWFKKKNSF